MNWKVCTVDFEATAQSSDEKYKAINGLVTDGVKFHRPLYRSRILFDDGTLEYRYEVCIEFDAGFEDDEVAANLAKALIEAGLIDNAEAVRVS